MAVLSRRERNAETRRANETALVEATIGLLEEGMAFAEIGIEQIVSRAGLSRPTFYAYFSDKRALVLHLGAALEEDLGAAAMPWLEFRETDARATLAEMLDVFRRHRATVAAITEAATYDAEVARFWRAFHDRFMPGATERIATGTGLKKKDAAARAYALVWMTERSLTEHLSNPTVDERALLDQLTWMWLQATGQAP